METADGLNIDPRGEVTAIREEDGEDVTLQWGKIDDPDAGDFQDTLGVEDGEWVENDEDDDGTYFCYRIDGTRYRIYKDQINQP